MIRAAVLMMVTVITIQAQTNQFDFQRTRWGMTEDQVKQFQSTPAIKEWTDNDTQGDPLVMVAYTSTVAGLKSFIQFGFSNGKLRCVNVVPIYDSAVGLSKGQLESMFAAFASALTLHLGEGRFGIGSDSDGWRRLKSDVGAAFDQFYRQPKADMREVFINDRTFAYVRAEHNQDGTLGISIELDKREFPSL